MEPPGSFSTVVEYRCVMPLSLDEYEVGSRFAYLKAVEKASSSDSWTRLIERTSFCDADAADPRLEEGMHRKKQSRFSAPLLLRPFLSESNVVVNEESWDCFPYRKAKYDIPALGQRFSMLVETMVVEDDRGEHPNALQLSKETLEKREIEFLDLVDDEQLDAVFASAEDRCASFVSIVAKERCPLKSEYWRTCDPCCCVYVVACIRLDVPLQKQAESMALRWASDNLFAVHKKIWCTVDDWWGYLDSKDGLLALEDAILKRQLDVSKPTAVRKVETFQDPELMAEVARLKKQVKATEEAAAAKAFTKGSQTSPQKEWVAAKPTSVSTPTPASSRPESLIMPKEPASSRPESLIMPKEPAGSRPQSLVMPKEPANSRPSSSVVPRDIALKVVAVKVPEDEPPSPRDLPLSSSPRNPPAPPPPPAPDASPRKSFGGGSSADRVPVVPAAAKPPSRMSLPPAPKGNEWSSPATTEPQKSGKVALPIDLSALPPPPILPDAVRSSSPRKSGVIPSPIPSPPLSPASVPLPPPPVLPQAVRANSARRSGVMSPIPSPPSSPLPVPLPSSSRDVSPSSSPLPPPPPPAALSGRRPEDSTSPRRPLPVVERSRAISVDVDGEAMTQITPRGGRPRLSPRPSAQSVFDRKSAAAIVLSAPEPEEQSSSAASSPPPPPPPPLSTSTPNIASTSPRKSSSNLVSPRTSYRDRAGDDPNRRSSKTVVFEKPLFENATVELRPVSLTVRSPRVEQRPDLFQLIFEKAQVVRKSMAKGGDDDDDNNDWEDE